VGYRPRARQNADADVPLKQPYLSLSLDASFINSLTPLGLANKAHFAPARKCSAKKLPRRGGRVRNVSPKNCHGAGQLSRGVRGRGTNPYLVALRKASAAY